MYLLSPNQRERFRGQIFSEENNFKDPAEIARSGVDKNTEIKRRGITKLAVLSTLTIACILPSYTHKRNNSHSNT